MDFLKHNWGYVVLAVAAIAAVLVTCYLLFWARSDSSYVGGLMVQAEQPVRKLKDVTAAAKGMMVL